MLVSSSRAPSNPFSIIKQAKPKNSAELYYMWQDNLRGEQGTKCPRCPNLPPGAGPSWGLDGSGDRAGGEPGTPRGTGALGRLLQKMPRQHFLCRAGAGKGTAGGPHVASRKGRAFGHPSQLQGFSTWAPAGGPQKRLVARPPGPRSRLAGNSSPRRGSLSLQSPLSRALAYLQSSPAGEQVCGRADKRVAGR